MAEHVNAVLRKKCLATYASTSGNLALWIRRHQLAHRAKRGTCAPALPSPRVFAGPCLAWIIDREDPSWSPGRYNTGGSGAYGLPQALPGDKMSSAGSDWATNPYTQIRWMRGYTRSKYGSECAAKAYWESHSVY